MPCVLQESTETIDAQIIAVPSYETGPSLLEPLVQEPVEVAWVDDDVEYVGLDDEDPFKTLLSNSESTRYSGYCKAERCKWRYMLHGYRMKGHRRYCKNLISLHEQIAFLFMR